MLTVTVNPIVWPINDAAVRFYCTIVDGVKGCCLDGEKCDGSDVGPKSAAASGGTLGILGPALLLSWIGG